MILAFRIHATRRNSSDVESLFPCSTSASTNPLPVNPARLVRVCTQAELSLARAWAGDVSQRIRSNVDGHISASRALRNARRMLAKLSATHAVVTGVTLSVSRAENASPYAGPHGSFQLFSRKNSRYLASGGNTKPAPRIQDRAAALILASKAATSTSSACRSPPPAGLNELAGPRL